MLWLLFKRETLRFVRKNRLLGLTAVLVLGFGITASETTLSLMLAITQQQISGIGAGTHATIARQEGRGQLKGLSWSSFIQLREATPVGTIVACTLPLQMAVQSLDHNKTLNISVVSAQFFNSLGIELVAGTDILPGFENPNAERVAVISERLAYEWFGSPQNSLNQAITTRGVSLRVVGVASNDFRGLLGRTTDVWASPPNVVPVYMMFPSSYSGPNQQLVQNMFRSAEIWQKVHGFYALATERSLSGPELMSALAGMLRRLKLQDDLSVGVIAGISSDPEYAARVLTWIRLIFALTSALMLISALNFSGLLLARIPRQMEEVRLKQTFGATRRDLVGELAVGPILIVGCGSTLGTVFALVARRALPSLSVFSGAFSLLSSHVDGRVYVWTLFAGVVLVVALAGAPALRLLKDSGAPKLSIMSTRSKSQLQVLKAIVVSQVAFAISVTLLSGMIYHSVLVLGGQQLGFRGDNTVVAAIGVTEGRNTLLMTSSKGDFPLASATKDMLHNLGTLPLVEAVAVSGNVPLENALRSLLVSLPEDVSLQPRVVSFTVVSDEYFKAVGIPILAGQTFSSHDLTGDIKEVVISKSLADGLWPGKTAIGQVLSLRSEDHAFDSQARVIGVAADARYAGPKYQSDPMLYLPLKGTGFAFGFPFYITVRGHLTPKTVDDAVRQGLSGRLPGIGVLRTYSLSSHVNDALAEDWLRARLTLLGAFVLLMISYMGLYGALTFFVSFRARELAIRACLGASPKNIVSLVLKSALNIGIIGSLSAVILWLTLTPILLTYLPGAVSATPSLVSALILIIVCFLGLMGVALMPARNAARLSPIVFLKET